MIDHKILSNLFKSYDNAKENKTKKPDVVKFELHRETNIFCLYREIMSGNYQCRPSDCFISFKPVKREIFAADFRDRIVHHFIYSYLSPLFESRFINDAYSCRVGKGVLYGINRLDHFIRSCSQNYSKDCYILKLDIKGYFMSIDRNILYNKIKYIVDRHYCGDLPIDILYNLINKIVYGNPIRNCIIKGKREDWRGLPRSKSLFYAKLNCGLPIGNLTSQLFGNVYLSDFDHYVKGVLGCHYYGRYVDDMVFVHRDKDFLKSLFVPINKYLNEKVGVKIHPKKIYLQHYSKGVLFLGSVLKPHRSYVANKVKGNFYSKIRQWNDLIKEDPSVLTDKRIEHIISGMNSYLGLFKHHKTFKIRCKMITMMSNEFWHYAYLKNFNVIKKKEDKKK